MKKRVFILMAALTLLLTACGEKASVGVIGGADGPTAVYVSGSGDTSNPAPVAEPAPAEESAPAEEPAPAPEQEPEAEPAPADEPTDSAGITADELAEGTYSVKVDSSSEKFNITACELTVAGGKMTAVMHMGAQGYLSVYMGTGEEAEAAPETDRIPFHEEADGTHSFTVPVEALDKELDCAAFSKRKEIWYDRTLVFRADSLPTEAFANLITPESLGLADGEYTVEVSLSGGSGKAKVESPAKLAVSDGQAVVTLVWGSPNYDYMRIGEDKYLPIQTEGNATFEIPVPQFDRPFTVFADTTAMSEPHEIEYTLTLTSATIQ